MARGKTSSGWPKLVMLVVGGGCSILGLAVFFGWYTANESLIHVSPALPPMQPNTALSFWLCGMVWPTIEVLATLASRLDEAVLFTGIVIAALLAWLVHFVQVGRWRMHETTAINHSPSGRDGVARGRAAVPTNPRCHP